MPKVTCAKSVFMHVLHMWDPVFYISCIFLVIFCAYKPDVLTDIDTRILKIRCTRDKI